MSNEQPPVRKVIPYKSGKRPSTFRRLNIDFAGTALEEALNKQEQQEHEVNQAEISSEALPTEEIITPSPPVATSHHQSPLPVPSDPASTAAEVGIIEAQQGQSTQQVIETEGEEVPPVTTTPQQEKKASREAIAPARDFNRRANSLERDALPSGMFPGSTKKVYDALYLRTIGAVVPVKRVKASRRDLLTWTGIRNLKTIDNHIRYLMAKGLIIRHWELGSNEGSSYEVCLPEEVRDQSPPVTTSGGDSPPDTTSQKLGIPTTQKMGSGGEGQFVDNITDYPDDKTSFKTKERNTDDEAFAEFAAAVRKTAKEITGKEPSKAEAARWAEVAEVLMTELRIAAGRTTISSVPAFLAEHLRRRLWKKEKREIEREAAEQKAASPARNVNASACPDCFGTGMYYPGGFEKGVARCPHSKLAEQAIE